MTAKQRHRLEVERRDPHVCALAHRGGCRGALQADHVVELAWLTEWFGRRRYRGADVPTADEVAADGRNGWLLCERHHGLKTAGLLLPPIMADELPAELDAFLDDHGCAGLLEGRSAFGLLA